VRTLGQGGFGITYLAEQRLLKKQFAIKEFFLRNLCVRGGKNGTQVTAMTEPEMVGRYREKFIKEAQIIARFEHPGIVKVTDVFEENGTIYYVMDYVEGHSLADILEKEGRLPEPRAIHYIRKVAAALGYIHSANVNHLDIKPANIMVRDRDDEPVIIDFGVSKQYDEKKDETTTTPPGISEGYSPSEQYKAGGVSTFSPESDVYALGATLYKMVTGNRPPAASDVLNNGLPAFPPMVSRTLAHAVEKAMEPKRKERPASVGAFLALLPNEDAERTVIPNRNEETVLQPPTPIRPSMQQQVGKMIESMGNAPVKGVNHIIQRLIDNMVPVQGGTFTMGEKYSWLSGLGQDNKAHQVTVSSFRIGKYPVTQEEWRAVMGDNPGDNPSINKGDKLPVENVSWNDCKAFILTLNRMTGKKFRLPTEAEWEFAARGGKKSRGYKYSGSNTLNDVAWYVGNSGSKTHEVGTKAPNELGLYDMSGNVYESCEDKYDTANYNCRGGSALSMIMGCVITYRFFKAPDYRSGNIGFRLAL